MDRPRILQLVLSLNPGGTERLVLELTKRLHEEMPMAVCCLDSPGSWASELESCGIPVEALERTEGFHPSLGYRVARLARKHDANVIHCHHYSPLIYGCLSRAWRPQSRVVFTEHGRLSDASPSRKRRVANQIFARVPKAAFAVSRELRQHLVEEGFPPDSIGVIYNGIDAACSSSRPGREEIRGRLGVDRETLVIGTIARLDPVKDLGTLIRSLCELDGGVPAVLVIIGDGTERSALEATAREAGVEARVRFLGQRNDARDWLAGCDVYANSSISEGVSLTILEAMAAALPVVVTSVGGTPEVVDQSSGVLVPPRAPRALAEAFSQFHRDPALRTRMGKAALQRVQQSFTLDRMVREYRDVYLRIA